jgi:hypothetical protein
MYFKVYVSVESCIHFFLLLHTENLFLFTSATMKNIQDGIGSQGNVMVLLLKIDNIILPV